MFLGPLSSDEDFMRCAACVLADQLCDACLHNSRLAEERRVLKGAWESVTRPCTSNRRMKADTYLDLLATAILATPSRPRGPHLLEEELERACRLYGRTLDSVLARVALEWGGVPELEPAATETVDELE